MKKMQKYILGFLAIGLLMLGACKKKEDDSVRGKLLGNWKLTAMAFDADSNGVMSASEKMDITPGDSLEGYVTFNGDGTGVTGMSNFVTTNTNNFTWSFINGEADLKITDTSGETITHIESISKSDLVFKDTEVSGGVTYVGWTFWKKQ